MSEVKHHNARTIERFFNSRVDIIIPFHGQYDLVGALVESILRSTLSNIYRIFLVDDCSPNSSFIDSLGKIPVVSTLRTPKQLGFGGAMRFGFEASQKLQESYKAERRPEHPYVVFMNSDCRVEDVNWLKSLGMALIEMKDAKVRMVAPRTNNPLNGDPRQEGKRDSHSSNIILDDTHLSMYCFMCHRDLFRHVGGFIKEYPFGFYEDEEFAYRMKKHGYKQAIAGQSWVYHKGEATIRELWRKNQEARTIMEANRDLCITDMLTLIGSGSRMAKQS